MTGYAQANQSKFAIGYRTTTHLLYTVLTKNDDLHGLRVVCVIVKISGP